MSYRSGLSSAGVLMSDVIVLLIKRVGQVEKKSAQVLTLGGERAGRSSRDSRERMERDITGGELEAHRKVGRAQHQGG